MQSHQPPPHPRPLDDLATSAAADLAGQIDAAASVHRGDRDGGGLDATATLLAAVDRLTAAVITLPQATDHHDVIAEHGVIRDTWLHRDRDASALARRWLAIQPRLDGRADIHGSLDPETAAAALAAFTATPTDHHDDHEMRRHRHGHPRRRCERRGSCARRETAQQRRHLQPPVPPTSRPPRLPRARQPRARQHPRSGQAPPAGRPRRHTTSRAPGHPPDPARSDGGPTDADIDSDGLARLDPADALLPF